MIAVCAVNYADERSSYSELGANLWICGPSNDSGALPDLPSIATTHNRNRYRDTFGGTSASAPIVSGVVVLMRAENENLTWRDVKLVLAESARQNDSGNTGWLTGATKFGSDTESYSFNLEYGFGMVDAKAAVELAKTWTTLPPWRQSTGASGVGSRTISDGSTISSTLDIDSFVGFVEFVEVNVDLDHSYFRELEIVLLSPPNTQSILTTSETVRYGAGLYGGFRFGSARHLGENPQGTWTLTVQDRQPGDFGIFRSWSMKVYGHGITPNGTKIDSLVPGDQKITVDWSEPDDKGQSDPTKYDLRYQRSDDTSNDWVERLAIATDDTASYELTGLEPGVFYDIQMRAHNDGGEGTWSETTRGNTSPVAPMIAPAITDIADRHQELVVTWNAPRQGQADLSGYRVRYILTSADETDDANWSSSTYSGPTDDLVLSHSIAGLTNGQQYDVQVRAVRGSDESPWSTTMTGTPFRRNQDPSFPMSETGMRSIKENTGPAVNVGARVGAIDSNGDRLTYSLSGPDQFEFDIEESTGQLKTQAEFDFEGSRTSFSVTVEVTDNKDANGEGDDSIDARQAVEIMIEDVNEAPMVSGTQDFEFDEDRGRWDVGSFSATDPEMDLIEWALSGVDRGDFQIDEFGQLSFRNPPDYDSPVDADGDSKYEVEVVASDGSLKGSLEVTVTVEDVNEPPVITGDTDIDFNENSTSRVGIFNASDPENPTSPVIWSLGGSDASQFELRGSSRGRRDLYFKSAPDFEEQVRYEVTIQASDGTLTGRRDVDVNITDLDERETLTLASDQPVQDVLYEATFTEADQATNRSWLWQRSASRSSGWTDITGETSDSYMPVLADVGYFLRVTVTYDDTHLTDRTLTVTSSRSVIRNRLSNNSPMFPSSTTEGVIPENSSAGTHVMSPAMGTMMRERLEVVAEDADNDRLSYSLDGPDAHKYQISGSGVITLRDRVLLNHEADSSDFVTVTARDAYGGEDSVAVTITVQDVNEPPIAVDDTITIQEDSPATIFVLQNDQDPEGVPLTVTQVATTRNADLLLNPDAMTPNNNIFYGPITNFNGRDDFTYRVSDGTHSVSATVIVFVTPVNDAPEFSPDPVELEVAEDAEEGDQVGKPVTASDVDKDRLTYSMFGASEFQIDDRTGQITVARNAVFDIVSTPSYIVTVEARDPDFASDSVVVTINVVEQVTTTNGGGGGGGGGGPPPVPVPSDEEFDWNVTRDIEELHRDNDLPTGLWSNGSVLWVIENSATGPDLVFAYDLSTGERLEAHEFELDRRNRFSHGIWSDDETVWIADSGQDRLFAYQLDTGERDESRDLELGERNRDPRGSWSNGQSMLVLDSIKDALFVYDLDSGRLLAEFRLDSLNKSPRGIWSDGFTIWVSDDGAKRLFAYRIDGETLTRHEEQEFSFRPLLKAGNGDPRGTWSDADVIFVVDEQDDHVYTYNMPDAIDARLVSLELSDVEFGEFAPSLTDYTAVVPPELASTMVTAVAAQDDAAVEITPADADDDSENGHQAALIDGQHIAVSVTSEDVSRTLIYRVAIRHCLTGLSNERLSLGQYVGGSVNELIDCARNLGVDSLYHYGGGGWVGYFVDAPEFLNHAFRDRFSGGVPNDEPLTVKRESIGAESPTDN